MSQKNTPEGQNIANLLKEAEAITNEAAQAKKTDTVPQQATEPNVIDTEAAYQKELGRLSNEITNAVLAGDKERVQTLTQESIKLMDAHKNGNVVELSKFRGLKTKALSYAKNKKVLIGTAAVVALGVIIKIATNEPVVEETQQPQDENPDTNEPVALDEV